MEGIKQDLIQDHIDLLGRIPIFDGLSIDECRRVMSIGEPVKYPTGSTIYQTNSPGSQMLVILLGKVSIQTPEGLEVAQVEAVDTVGEMEIFTLFPPAAVPSPKNPPIHLLSHRLRRKRTVLKTTR